MRTKLYHLSQEIDIIHVNPDKDTTDQWPLTADNLLAFIQSGAPYIQFYTNQADWMTLLQPTFQPIHAAGGLVKNEQGAFLFIERLGKWDLPKGKIEVEESPQVAAIREVQEETGLGNHLQIEKSLPVTFHLYQMGGQWLLKTTYWFLINYSGSLALKPQTKENITAAHWLSESEWSKVLENTYPNIRIILTSYKD